MKDFPDYGGGMVAQFSWLLEKLGGEFAITLNPGLSFGMDFEAEDLAQIVAMARPK